MTPKDKDKAYSDFIDLLVDIYEEAEDDEQALGNTAESPGR